MRRLLARRERHGWSLAELSRRSGLPAWKLSWWHRRLAKKRPACTSARAFVPVKIVDSPPKDLTPLEVITASGVRILVPVEFDPNHLRRVLKALDSGC